MPLIQRRAFLTGILSTLAAPAVVRAASIMPVKALPPSLEYRQLSSSEMKDLLRVRMADVYRITRENMSRVLYENAFGNPMLAALYTEPPPA